MATLLARTLSDTLLLNAWRRVQVNAGGPGSDGITIDQFNQDAEARLRRLRKQVLDNRYVPQPLRRITLPRPGRGPRLLAVPTVRDRILQTAAALALGPELEQVFGPCSFGYRPGRCVIDAIEHVIRGHEHGFEWAVDADIHGFFDHIRHTNLIERLEQTVSDHSLSPLIEQWLLTPTMVDGLPQRSEQGIAQGSPISPLLANLYLDGLDRCVASAQQWLVRYADDFLILCRTYDQTEIALEQAGQWLIAQGLDFAYDKTRITRFANGFEFLGVRFHGGSVTACDPDAEPWVLPRRLRRYTLVAQTLSPSRKRLRTPQFHSGFKSTRADSVTATSATTSRPAQPAPAGPAHAPAAPPTLRPTTVPDSPPLREQVTPDESGSPDESIDRAPLLRTLHICENGNYLHREGGRFIVGHGPERRLSIPMHDLDQVYAQGEGAVSFSALRAMLEHHIGFVLDGHAGPSGWLAGADLGHLELQRAQFRRLDQAGFQLDIARALVVGKIANSRVLLRRYLRLRGDCDTGALDALKTAQRAATSAATLDVLRGHEGQAAKLYFAALGALLPQPWQLHGRNRHPPRDPVNALLSYGYAVLFQNVLTLLVRRGLNPCVGVLHALRDGHAALASDLMEEFRALVVDAVVLRMILRGSLSPAEFEQGDAACPCRLSHTARQRYLQALENRLDSPLTDPANGQLLDYRRVIESQVALYADVVCGRAIRYTAFTQR